jgi:hypothetical protein
MSTYIVAWAEDVAATPTPYGTAGSLEAAQEWCQYQANQLAGDVLPLLAWKHYLSRGTGPGTAHYTAGDARVGAFAVWVVGSVDLPAERTCEHPGVFAYGDASTYACPHCGQDVPAEEL